MLQAIDKLFLFFAIVGYATSYPLSSLPFPRRATKTVHAKQDDSFRLQVASHPSPTRSNIDGNDVVNVEVSGLDKSEEDDLELLFTEALFRMSFFMETNYFQQVENQALRDLFETCLESVEIKNSTIPQAGRGLFATKDIPKHTIVALYAIDCIGCRFPSGVCQSVQLSNQPQEIDHEKSQYRLFDFCNRRLCGVDLDNFNEARLFVDMNPQNSVQPGWYAGLVNDGATVQTLGDLDYYPQSRRKQNVELMPFSVAPFHVAVTTRDVKQGEELFTTYGYNYWVGADHVMKGSSSLEKSEDENEITAKLQEQTDQIVQDIERVMGIVYTKYHEAAWVLGQIFDHEMNGEQAPSTKVPLYNNQKSQLSSQKQVKKRYRLKQWVKRKLLN